MESAPFYKELQGADAYRASYLFSCPCQYLQGLSSDEELSHRIESSAKGVNSRREYGNLPNHLSLTREQTSLWILRTWEKDPMDREASINWAASS